MITTRAPDGANKSQTIYSSCLIWFPDPASETSSTILTNPQGFFCFCWRIPLPKGQLCFLAIVRVLLPHTCVLLPHGTVAQLREPHCKVSAAIFESHLQSVPSCFKAGVNLQGDNDQALPVLLQLASEDDNVVEEEDTDGKVFLDTSCQDQPV